MMTISRWVESYNNHPFQSDWATIKGILSTEKFVEEADISKGLEIARARKVVAYMDTVLEQIDPELLPSSFLQNFYSQVNSALNELNAFSGNGNLGHLQNANNQIDGAIVTLSQTPFVLTGLQKGSLTKAATAYSEAVNNLVESLSSDVAKRLADLTEQYSVVEIERLKNIQGLQALETQIKTNSDNVQGQLAQFNTQFQTGEVARTDRFEGIVNKLGERADTEFSTLTTKAGTILGVLSKFQDDAQEVLGVVVNTAQAGAYASYANEEKKSANTFRFLALVLMLIGVSVLVIPEILKIAQDQGGYVLDWHRVLGRIPFSLILFVPAFYLAKESNTHRNNEVLNRRRQLILTTIHPYLALLKPDKAEQIKADVAKGIFSEGTALAGNDEIEASNIVAQLTNFAKILLKQKS